MPAGESRVVTCLRWCTRRRNRCSTRSAQVLAVRTPREIPAGQGSRQVLLPHFRAPVDDRWIQPVSGGLEFCQVDQADFSQAGRIADGQGGFEGPVAARGSREALQPHDAADQDMVQRPDHRAEKGTPVFSLERFRHFRRRRVEALVHRAVGVAEEDELGFFARGVALGTTGRESPPGNADEATELVDPRGDSIWGDAVFLHSLRSSRSREHNHNPAATTFFIGRTRRSPRRAFRAAIAHELRLAGHVDQLLVVGG